MPFLKQPHANQYYDVFGEQGPWITLINGHTRSSTDFKAMAKFLAQKGARVLICDNRGSGQTTNEGSFNLKDMAEDVIRLWDHLDIAKSHLLGISMGGLISQYLAAHFSHRIDRLALISTTSDPSAIRENEKKSWGHDQASVEAKLANYFSARFRDKNKLLVEAMAKQILKQITAGDFLENARMQSEAIWSFDATPYLSQIEAETLIVHGLEDRIISPEKAEVIAAKIAKANLHLIEGVGHLLLAEYPKPLYEMVADFFL